MSKSIDVESVDLAEDSEENRDTEENLFHLFGHFTDRGGHLMDC